MYSYIVIFNIIIRAPRAFKMAAGENPKNVYGSRTQLPSTRMGNISTTNIKEKGDRAGEGGEREETREKVADQTLIALRVGIQTHLRRCKCSQVGARSMGLCIFCFLHCFIYLFNMYIITLYLLFSFYFYHVTKIQKVGTAQQSPRPYNAQLEPLVAILRGEALVNVHCYEVF